MTDKPPPPLKCTILECEAEHVGGWTPDAIGCAVVSTEGPLHPRVGTQVRDLKDAQSLPDQTIIEQYTVLPGSTGMQSFTKERGHWVCFRFPYVHFSALYSDFGIGARILYVPLEEP